MKIDKQQIIDLIRSQMDAGKAKDAERELPDEVDTERDGGLLSKYGVDIGELLKKFGGGGLGKLLG